MIYIAPKKNGKISRIFELSHSASKQIISVCMIWVGMFANGAGTGTAVNIMKMVKAKILKDQ